MPRRPLKKKIPLAPDYVYNSQKIAKLVNRIMKSGKKETARAVVYDTLTIIKEKTKRENPLEVYEEALYNVGPSMEIRSRRIGGANYLVPREVRPERKIALALRWIIEAARLKKGAPMREKLADELIAASKNEGTAVTKRDQTHKMAEANKAFAHFAW
jgi:small subunit ribosomal protein S7